MSTRIVAAAALVALFSPAGARAEEEAAALVAQLASPDPADRVDAVRGLAALGDPAVAPHLALALERDPSADVRGWAARSLATLGTAEASRALAEAAETDPDPRVRTLSRRLAGLPEPAELASAPPLPPAPAQGASAPAVTYVPQVVEPPPPIRRTRVPGQGLIVGGWVTFGISYGLGFIAGAAIGSSEDAAGWYMMIPVIGPGVTAFLLEGDDDAVRVLLWLWVGAEAAGAAMAIAGHVIRARALRGPATARRRTPAVALVPSGPAGGPGLTLVGSFF